MKRTMKAGTLLLAMAALVLATGCPAPKPIPKDEKKPDKAGEAKAHDEHAHEGPHGGALAEWGEEEYHAEFTVDHGKKEVRVYILGPDCKTPVPIAADKVLLSIRKPAFQVELRPQAQKNDPKGKASCFAGTHDKFGVEQEFEGTISGEVDGKPYAGDFKEEAEGHDHKHEKKTK